MVKVSSITVYPPPPPPPSVSPGLTKYLERTNSWRWSTSSFYESQFFSAKTSYVKVLLCNEDKKYAVTYSDEHVREGASGVFRHIDRWDDPVSLLSPQPVDRGASLMSSGELDNSGLGFPHSCQHFFDATLKRKSQTHIYHFILHFALNYLRILSFEECNLAMTGWKMNLQRAVKWHVFSAQNEAKILGVMLTIKPIWESDREANTRKHR